MAAELSKRAGKDPNAPKTFTYVAVSPYGERRKEKMTAGSRAEVSAALEADGWIPVEITQAPELSWNVDLTGALFGTGVKFGFAERADFARRLHQMLKAGISVPKALTALGEDSADGVQAMCEDLTEKVQSGQPLSAALANHPRAFDDIFIAYMQAGEESGTLVETTHRLAIMLGKRSSLALKIKGVTQYPKMVASAIGVLVIGIIAFLVPRYAKIYEGFNAKLPAPTQALVDFSHHFTPIGFHWGPLPGGLFGGMKFPIVSFHPFAYASILAYLALAVWIFLRQTKDNEEIGIALDKLRFRMPVMGKLWAKMSLYRWSSTLAGAMATSVPTTRAIDLAAAAAGSRWQASVAPQLVDAVRTGRTIGGTLSEVPRLFPANVRTMVTTGETVGELAEMLDNVASTLDDEVDAIVAGLSAKIEVALLLVLGGVVGSLLMVLYLPILNLATAASNGLG
jgi:type IV pilus assembly protein PilC